MSTPPDEMRVMAFQRRLLVVETELAHLKTICTGSASTVDWEDAAGGNTVYKFTVATKTLDTLTLTLASRSNDAAFETVTFTKAELETGNDDWTAWVETKWNVIQRAGWNLGEQNEAWANWQVWSRVNRNGTVVQVREQNNGVDNSYGKVYDIAAKFSA